MAIPVLQSRVIMGLRTNIKANVHFITDEEILYPVGSVLALHSFNQGKQRIIKLSDKTQPVSLICVSPAKKVVAICEKGDKPNITIYDTTTLKKRKIVGVPQIGDNPANAKEFITIQFTMDSKYLIGITGEPDWMLYCYNWEKGKIESWCKAINPNGTGTIVQLSCNPSDPTTICLVGDQLFRLLATADSVWRQWGYSKADLWSLTCAVWLSQDRIFAGSVDGNIYYLEGGEFKLTWRAYEVTVYNLKKKEEAEGSTTSIAETSISSGDDELTMEVLHLTALTRGFCYVCGNGLLHFFEKNSPNKYIKRNVYRIPAVTFREGQVFDEMSNIQCLALNITEDRIVVSTLRTQLYQIRLWGPDLNLMPEVMFQPLGPQLHHGPISTIAVCAWKPIFITCGELDRSLRIWNYETESLLMIKQYEEDVHGVALHPSGLYAAVGFADKLRYMTVLIDDISMQREFPIRCCKECAFSTHGQFFAAVNGNVIQVYSTISFENVYNLRGHNGKITALSWTAMDLKLVSCGSEGAIYEWDMSVPTDVKRSSELIIKTCPYTGCAVSSDGNYSYAIGIDGYLKKVADSQLMNNIFVCSGPLDSLAKGRADLMLFISGPFGVIYSIKIPIIEGAVEYNEYKFHCMPVTKLRLTYDDKYLISASIDGSIVIWKLLFIEGKAIKLEKEFSHSAEILISRDDLEEKITSIRELTVRLQELETEHAYHFRQMEAAHSEKMKEVHEGYCKAIEELKEKNEQLETEHTIEINNINADITKMKNGHEQAIQVLELTFNEKLINEYDKYGRLEDKLAAVRRAFTKQLDEMAQSRADALYEMAEGFQRQLNDKDVQLEELHEEMKQKTREHELIKQQIEDDADREIFDLKTLHETIIREEQETNIKLKGETLIMRKKFVSAQKEIDDLRHHVHQLEDEHSKFKTIIEALEKDITDLKRETTERDQTIHDKENRIYDLKRKNQELEKFRFVLNYKIKELKGQIEPKEQEIQDQRAQIEDMVAELETLQKTITSLELQLTELREKLAAADREFKIEQSKVRQCRALLRRMRTDLHELAGLIQEPLKLKTALKEMYHRYNDGKDFQISQVEDSDARNEFLRQREYLERTVRGLKKAATRHEPGKQEDKMRVVEESSILIAETNLMRYEYKETKRQKGKMESLLGLKSKLMPPKEAQEKVIEAMKTKEEIHDQYKLKILLLEKNIAALREENLRLVSKIMEHDQVIQTVEVED